MKYGSARTHIGGKSFPSKLEAAVYAILLIEEKARLISEIECQSRVALTRAALSWKIDFRVTYSRVVSIGKTKIEPGFVWVEARGFETDRWKICEKLWVKYGPGPLLIYKGHFQRPCLSRIIIPAEA